MLQELEFGLYITAIGMGGVFTILSLLALFMYLIGRVERRSMEIELAGRIGKENVVSRNEEMEEIAIISAALAYHMEGETQAVPFISSTSWKRFAREFSLRK